MIKKNYYELLNISQDATVGDVERAYNGIRDLYNDESDALYSLVSKEDKEQILSELEKAHSTLTDPEKRRAYDIEFEITHNEGVATAEVELSSILHEGKSTIGQAPLKAVRSDFTHTATLINPLIVSNESKRIFAEQYRVLFTRLEDLFIKRKANIFAITSALKGDGKTVTAVNLTSVMAGAFAKKTLLIEADMRKPMFSSYFNWEKGTPGLREILTGSVRPADAVMKLDGSMLHIIHAGLDVPITDPINASRMDDMLKEFRTQFEYIIIDSPPIIPLADINILSRLVDGLLLVVRAGVTPRDSVLKATKMITENNIIGIVLNDADASTISIENYYY